MAAESWNYEGLPDEERALLIARDQIEREQSEIGKPEPYENYRAYCDVANDAFRRLGILDEKRYASSLEDPRTIMCNIDGRTFPALVAVEFEDRYDANRSKKLTDKEQVMLLTIPMTDVREAKFDFAQIVEGHEERGDFAILVEQIHEDEEYETMLRQDLAETFSLLFGEQEIHEFKTQDPRIKNPENQTAWMAIYDFAMESTREIDPKMLELEDTEAIMLAWDDYKKENGLPKEPAPDFSGAYIFNSSELEANPGLVNALWEISQKGFGEVLGEGHPISMQVNKSFFVEHLKSEKSLVGVNFFEGKPISFGFLAASMDYNDWIDPESTKLKEVLDSAEQDDRLVVHFFELISDQESGKGASIPILNLFLELGSRVRKRIEVIFESTNKSDRVIPKIVRLLVGYSESVNMLEDVEKVSQLNYWFLKKATSKKSPSTV